MQTEIAVLDKGFVQLVEWMGGDRGVVQSARVSYNSQGLKTPDEDKKLIAYLLKNQHGTPFEQAVFKFHVKCPIFAMRQWIRHRMSSYNELSGRYAESKLEFYIPESWRIQDKVNKQGSLDEGLTLGQNRNMNAALSRHCAEAANLYKLMLKDNIAKEMARFALPLNLYTEFYWTVNARALMHFIKLRSDSHAQWEMQQYSNALAKIFSEIMPWTYAAFEEHVLFAESLSALEVMDGHGQEKVEHVFCQGCTDS